MPRGWEDRKEVELDASAEQAWAAIATGRGLDAWLMGRSRVEPGVGGTVRTDMGGGFTQESTVTAWDPPRRFALRSAESADGRFIAYEWRVEARRGGGATLRCVASGFLPGDDWDAEYEARMTGWEVFFRTLVQYLTHFRGRTATSVAAFGPPSADWPRTWAALHAGLGLTGGVAEGDRIRLAPRGLAPIEGVVAFSGPDFLGLRAGDALYRFLHGLRGAVVVAHLIYAADADADVDQAQTRRAWQAWLGRLRA